MHFIDTSLPPRNKFIQQHKQVMCYSNIDSMETTGMISICNLKKVFFMHKCYVFSIIGCTFLFRYAYSFHCSASYKSCH